MGRETRRFLVQTFGFLLVLELILIPAILWWPVFEENVSVVKGECGVAPVAVPDEPGV